MFKIELKRMKIRKTACFNNGNQKLMFIGQMYFQIYEAGLVII
jgi:hypothetical protein